MTDGTNIAPLSGVFKVGTPQDGSPSVALNTSVLVTDGTNLASFNFQYDTDGKQFGAGTAFLQPNPPSPTSPSS